MTVVPRNNTTFEYFGRELLSLQLLLYQAGRESRARADVEAPHAEPVREVAPLAPQQPLFPPLDPLEKLRAGLRLQHMRHEEGQRRQVEAWNRRYGEPELKAAA